MITMLPLVLDLRQKKIQVCKFVFFSPRYKHVLMKCTYECGYVRTYFRRKSHDVTILDCVDFFRSEQSGKVTLYYRYFGPMQCARFWDITSFLAHFFCDYGLQKGIKKHNKHNGIKQKTQSKASQQIDTQKQQQPTSNNIKQKQIIKSKMAAKLQYSTTTSSVRSQQRRIKFTSSRRYAATADDSTQDMKKQKETITPATATANNAIEQEGYNFFNYIANCLFRPPGSMTKNGRRVYYHHW